MTQTTNAMGVVIRSFCHWNIYFFVIVSDFVFRIVSYHGEIDRKSMVFDPAVK